MWWTRWWWAGAGIGASASGQSTRCCCSCAPMMMMMMMIDQVCDCSPQGHQHNIQYNIHFFATTFFRFWPVGRLIANHAQGTLTCTKAGWGCARWSLFKEILKLVITDSKKVYAQWMLRYATNICSTMMDQYHRHSFLLQKATLQQKVNICAGLELLQWRGNFGFRYNGN